MNFDALGFEDILTVPSKHTICSDVLFKYITGES